jgi:CBS domain-containing protein
VSAPVYDLDGVTFLGLVDALDILAYIVSIFDEIEQQGASIFNRLENEARFSKVTVSQVADFAHNAAPQLSVGTSLWDALMLFVDKKAHRILIVSETGQIVSILTQAAVINLVAAHPGCLGELGKRTVKDLDLGSRPVLVVEKHVRAIDAFKKMHEHHISGIGVMDHNGYLIGNISARDLKELDPQNIYQSMYESSAHFV